MSKYKELVYLILDFAKTISDDSDINENHIMYLLDKTRIALLEQKYTATNLPVGEDNYQTVCLNLEPYNLDDCECGEFFLRSKEVIPQISRISNTKVFNKNLFSSRFTLVSRERLEFTGINKWLKNFIYCAIGDDNRLYIKSTNPQSSYLTTAKISAVFDSANDAAELSCDGDIESNCDIMAKDFPMEESLTKLLIEAVLREVLGAAWRPKDYRNDASDALGDIATFLNNKMKKGYTRGLTPGENTLDQ